MLKNETFISMFIQLIPYKYHRIYYTYKHKNDMLIIVFNSLIINILILQAL